MELAQRFVFDLGWLFFAVWGTVLAALSVIAFGPDILAFSDQERGDEKRNARRSNAR